MINRSNLRTRRHLYPLTFVKRLAEIAGQDYVGARLPRDQWGRFQEEVAKAYAETITPFAVGYRDRGE